MTTSAMCENLCVAQVIIEQLGCIRDFISAHNATALRQYEAIAGFRRIGDSRWVPRHTLEGGTGICNHKWETLCEVLCLHQVEDATLEVVMTFMGCLENRVDWWSTFRSNTVEPGRADTIEVPVVQKQLSGALTRQPDDVMLA